MDEILSEIERAAASGFCYLAVAMTLALPDICGALEAPDGRASFKRYKDWCRRNLTHTYGLRPVDFYSMRCGILHQGNLGVPNSPITHVVFSLRNASGTIAHSNILNRGRGPELNLDALLFCSELGADIRNWFSTHRSTPHVARNFSNLLRYRPNGLMPFISGIPVIA